MLRGLCKLELAIIYNCIFCSERCKHNLVDVSMLCNEIMAHPQIYFLDWTLHMQSLHLANIEHGALTQSLR